MWRGHTDASPDSSLEADVTGDPDDVPYVNTMQLSPAIEKRVHKLSTAQYIWDWSGNVWEWLDVTCTGGTGSGLWDNTNTGYWEWSFSALQDYEKGKAGPEGNYISIQNAGVYFGCTSNGNAVIHGGAWASYDRAGVYAFNAKHTPYDWFSDVGFRCAR